MWPLPTITSHTKIGLASSTLLHVGLVVAGLAMSAPYVAPHFHLHRGSIEIQGSFAAETTLETTVPIELSADSESLEIAPPATPVPAELTPVKNVIEPKPLPPDSSKRLAEIAVCDCPATEHVLHTPKRRPEEPQRPEVAPPASAPLPRAVTVAQVAASQVSASEVSLPSAAEPAGSDYDQPPTVIPANRPPPYPADAYQLGLQGRVLIEVRVNTQGTAESLRLVESSGVGSLDRSALETVRSWRFEPARRQGRPVEALVNVPVRFKIRTN